MKKIYSLLLVSFLFAFNHLSAGNYHDSIPEQCSNTTGGALILSHTNAQSGATSNGTLKVDFFGDLDLSTEYVDVLSENGTLLATLSTATQCGLGQQIISLDKDSINAWALDGNISFTYQSSTAVNSGICTGVSGPAAFCVVPVVSYTYQQGVDNIGVLSLDAPSPGTCSGTTPITITVGNFGTNQVDTFSVAWEINGVTQTPQTYYTLLDTNGGTNPTTTQITLNPSYNFTALTTFKFWTYSPNNVLDTINQNDTLQTALSPALAGVYTIGSGGNYINFTAAVNDLVALGVCAPVTFNVLTGSGPFNEQIEIPQVVGASSTNTITFNGNGETITYSTTGTTDNYIIRLNGADYIAIDSLNLVAQSSINNFVIQLTNDADFNTINNCNIDLSSTLSSTSSSNAGIVVSGSLTSATTAGASGTNNTFTNNTITGGYYGLTINGASSTSESLNNTISGNTIQDFYYYGTYLRSISNSFISNNDIHRMNRSSVSSFYGLYFVTSGGRNLVEANQIHDAYTGIITASTSTSYPIYHTGIDVAVGDENRVVNNLIYNINNNGTVYGIYNFSSDGVYYYHNTISLDEPNSTAGTTRGFYQTSTASNIEFKNNIISVTRGGTGTKHCIYFATTASTITSNNNVFYINAPAGTNNLGYYGGDQGTLLAWQTASSGDANSVDDDPMFANPTSGQFAPTNAAIDGIADASVNVTTDIYGVTRAVTPDPGAIEFIPPSCPQPSNLAVTNVTGTTVDLSWTENGTATVWDIEWDTAGFTPTGIPTITGTTNNPHPLTGLTPLTDYEFYVRAYCSASDTSLWSGPYMFSTLCATQLSGAYTIGTAGNYLTFTDAINDMITCGISGPVVFNVLTGSGPFNEQITIPPIIGASGVNTITFNGNGEVITSTTSTSARSIILLDGADHVTFDSLIVQTQSSTNNFAIQLTNNADSNTINNCVVDLNSALTSTSSTNAGIVVSGSLTSATTAGASGAYNTITNNHIIGGYYGVTINGASSTSESMNNVVDSNRIEDFYFYGTYLRSISNSSISFNDISRPNRTSVSTFYGLYFITSGEGNIIEGNRLHDPFRGLGGVSTSASYPIYYSSVDANVGNENRVVNNLIYNINSNGTIYALYNIGSDGVHYYHNTISLDDQNATGGITRGFYQTTTASNIEFVNNIVTVTRAGSGVKYCLYFNTTTSTIVSNNNVLYTPTTINNTGYFGGNQNTLADWQTATSGDASSVDADPLYVNPTANDFAPSSPLVDGIADASVNVTTDIFGVTRAVTPDPGAIEFTPPSCPQPSNLTAINVLSNSADLSWLETGSATTWQIDWDTAGVVQGFGNLVVTTNNPHTLTGLSPQSEYRYYVRSICAVGDTSLWGGPYTLTTLCAPSTAPWLDDVETHLPTTNSTIENCWSSSPSGTTSAYRWDMRSGPTTSTNTGPSAAYSGQYYFYTEASSGSAGDVAELYTPLIDVSALTTPELQFYYHMYGVDINKLYIDAFDGNNWITLDSIVGQQHATTNDPWLKHNVIINGFPDTLQVRFRGIRGASFDGDIAIDDIEIREAPTCPQPIALNVSNVTMNSAAFGWTEVGSATNWQVEWGISGFTLGGGVRLMTTTNPHTQLGLQLATTYDFYVRSVCTPGDSSLWTGPYTFTTPCMIVTSYPYFEDFENGKGCWIEDNTTNGSWGFGTPAMTVINSAASGINAFATGNLNGTYNANENSWVLSPIFDFTNANNPKIEMEIWWNSEFSWDGVVLQSSINNGASWQNVGAFGDTVNWYTDNSINGTPGGQQEGWSGRNSSSNGSGTWVTASHMLDGLNNQSNVQLRVAFGSDGSVQDEGFAFDDIHIFDVVCPNPTNLGNDTIICGTDSLLLDAGAGYATYLWSDSLMSTSQTIIVDSATYGIGVHTFYVSVTDSVSNCLSKDTIVVEITTCVGIEDLSSTIDLNVYPNPNKGQFTLNLTTQNTTDLQIRITNIQGQEVFVKNNFDNINVINEEINIGNVKGVYFLNIITNNEVVTKKIIVQ
ncbi:MAG: fibronectin type III domain-containing protein [Flavobacteriales bacterium]|nr:fibronectin type III domain-containing protein [Flavobacteriales bacterium]MCW8913673.1 fibronectin type III domain-containing protein [Flavobacteriales bacterium]MCW8937845.1 fibronectin type III domain-containing protein [Flavobacteriales bacterium]MCW8968345.1 fibronectin type III domain-containing protein [Flavobacteriales bacterium]MCW8990342.1 fibronectin type III domain-containing protein [Flavobacteriales bacterium]